MVKCGYPASAKSTYSANGKMWKGVRFRFRFRFLFSACQFRAASAEETCLLVGCFQLDFWIFKHVLCGFGMFKTLKRRKILWTGGSGIVRHINSFRHFKYRCFLHLWHFHNRPHPDHESNRPDYLKVVQTSESGLLCQTHVHIQFYSSQKKKKTKKRVNCKIYS